MTKTEAERRIRDFCEPQRRWLKEHAQNREDRLRLIGYEDGVSDALRALSAPVPGLPTKEGDTVTPREVLADFQRDDWNLKSVAEAAIAAVRAHDADLGLESVPTVLVDAVLDPRTPCGGSEYLAARRALRAYRAPVLLGQTEETP